MPSGSSNAWRRAAVALSGRHPALRTTFHDTPAGPVQRVGEAPQVDFVETAGRELDLPELLAHLSGAAFAPFDFERGPLWRLVLVRRDEGYLLALAIHHIVADFWSLSLLVRELGVLYARELGLPAVPLAEPGASFAEVVRREEERLSGAEGARQWEYWCQALREVPLVLDLPTDRPRPPAQGYAGAWRPFRLPAGTVDRLRRLSRRNAATLYMALLAGFEALLGRYTGQERLVVGSPTTGRVAPELAGLVGYLVNPVAIVGDLSGDPDFVPLLGRARAAALAAFAHQGYPFPLLAERLQPERDPGRSPVFQVLLVLQKGRRSGEQEIAALAVGEAGVRVGMGPLELESLAMPDPGAQLDLTVMLAQSGGELAGRLQYDRELFEAATIDRLGGHLAALLAAAAEEPGRRVSELPFLSAAERRQLLEWSGEATAYPRERTVAELFFAQAARAPQAVAVVTAQGEALSYGELAARAGRLAAQLRDLGVGPEVPVGLFLERSPGMVVATLAVLAAGGAYVPLDPGYPAERLAFLLAEARVPLLLSEEGLAGRIPGLPGQGARVVRIDRAGRAEGLPRPIQEDVEGLGGFPASGAGPESLAYVMFTSGSTGRPKGVGVVHRGVVRLVLETGYVRFGPDEVWLQLAPTAFDAATLEIWGALLHGGRLVLPPPGAPTLLELGAALARHGVTSLWLTAGLFHAMVEENLPGLRPLRQLLAGGDVLSPAHVARALAALPGTRLINGYGPTEGTTFTCCATVVAPVGAMVPLGRPIANTRVHVVDGGGRRVPAGVAGELWAGGDGLARGYLDRPELTAERFVPDPFGQAAGERMYRTGDRVRWRPDGRLEFLGRLDRQVKIRGFRIEPGEVEGVLAGHPAVAQAAVVVREDRAGEKRLVAYAVLREEADLAGYLRARLPEHLVPWAFVTLPALPLTVHGKLDRAALPMPERGEPAAVLPRTPAEARLAEIWSELLGRERVGVLDDFFTLGGHSLLATRLVSRVRQAFGVELPLRAVFEAPTVASLAARIESLEGASAAAPPLVPAARGGELPLSFAQQRLWFLDQLEPGSASYNVPGALRLSGRLSVAALSAAFSAIVERHETLRTTFRDGAAGPVQAIAPAAPRALPLVDLLRLPERLREATARALAREEAARPFDLATGPLARVCLLSLEEGEHVLLLTLHHIISDGWSLGVIVHELTAFYGTALAGRLAPISPLPPLAVQYADFALWQRSWLAGAELERQLAWWREHLAGAPALLALPADRPRPAEQSYRGGTVPVTLPKGLADRLTALGRESQATLFMVLLAGFAALLGRLSGSEDLVVGSPVANRQRAEVEGLIGFFVNTLALRLDLAGEPGFRDLLDRVREVTLGAYAHQDVPFEKLVEELSPERSLGHSPLFQVLLALQNALLPPLALPGLTLTPLPLAEGTAKFDLTLSLEPGMAGAGMRGTLEYNRDLFDRTTAERLAGGLARLLEAAVAAPQARLRDLPLLSPAERHQLLQEWNATPGEPGFRLLVLDRHLEPAPIGVPGELAAGGAELGSGYLGQPELTALQFVPDPFAAEPGARLYWTGDLARTLPSGEIDLLGRVDPRVKARVVRPAEPAGREATAGTAPRTPLEARLAELWAELLGRERVGVQDDFFALGGHSLLATRLVSRVRQAFGVELPLKAIFEAPTVAALAARLGPHLQPAPPSQPALVPVPREGDLPLSFAQERLWFLDQLAPRSASYNMAGAVRLTGRLSVAAMAAALQALAERHEALRTTFRSGAEGPVQVIAPAARLSLPVVDLAGLPPAPRAAVARRLGREEAERPFDLAAGPLARVGLLSLEAEEHVLLLTLHHIVADGWSLAVFVHELTTFYGAALAGRLAPMSPLSPLAVQYADFTLWQRSWLVGAELERQLAWWREHLAGAPTLLELPADRPRPAVQSFRGGMVPVVLTAGLADRLTALGQGSQATLFMVLLAGFAAFLGRLSGSEDLVVGSPVANRQRAELERLIGFFVNTLPLRADLSGEPGFRGLLDRVRTLTLGAYAHQDVPFEKLVEELSPERSLGHTPLFQAVLALQTAPVAAMELPGLELAPLPAVEGVAKFDLTVTLVPGTDGTLEYNRDLFDRTTARRFADGFVRLLAAAVATPDVRLGELPLLSAGERAQLLHEWNDTASTPPASQGALVHERFAAWARHAPAALAVAAPEGRLTYGDLDSRAARLSSRLRGLGVGPEVRVALCAGLSPLRVVGILAVLKAGGAYVPLDPESPAARLAFLLADCGAAVLLAERRLACRLPASPLAILYLDDDGPEPEGEDVAARPVLPDDLAYVVYTSGSTGVPKGVAVPHSGLLNLVLWHQERYGVTPDDRATQIASPAFDASVWELWPYLAAGASVHISPEETRLSPSELADWWEREGITWSFLPTPLAESVLAASRGEDGGGDGWGDGRPGLRLRGLLCGGDRLHRAPAPGLPFPLLNHYGPSEYSVVTTAAAVSPETAGLPPIGRPIANTRTVVLDAWGALAPMGVAGELAIGGAGLARGYLGRPELTAERFVPDPWSNEPGARLYRTGDLIRRLPNGMLDFLGRIDHQVKLRGFRIELGEIESALRGEAEVREAAVLVREDRPGDRRLVAYVTLAMDDEEGRSAAVRGLRQALERQLPAYMVPSAFVALDALPLSGNGKVDRRVLASRTPEEGPGDTVAVAPRTPLEARLAEIWAAVLGREKVGVLDDFFASGGHSLLATRLVSRVREALGVELPLRAVFEAPTVAALAARLGDGFDDSGLAAPLLQPLPPAAREGGLPLSFAQERLWFLDQLEPGSASYNIPGAVRLEGGLSFAALAAAFSGVVERHEALRTTFRPGAAGPVQVIAPLAGAGLPLPLVDLAGLSAAAREEAAGRLLAEEAARPFDLARGPLLRSTLLRLAPERHLAAVNLHHVVADGWSMDVFVRELAAFYGAALEGRPAALPPLPIQYADFAVWQRGWLAGPELERQLAWWRQRLAGVPTTLELPADRPRPPVLSARGGAVPVGLSRETAVGLTALARAAEATPFMVLFAGFSALLARYTGQEDLLLGSPVANRTRSEVEGLIGLFVNTLALRAELGGRPPFRDLVARAREMALGAYAHQDLPFERLVEELQPTRDLSRSPLFQVLLVLQNNPASPFVLPGLTLETAEVDAGVTKFDLQLTLFEASGTIAGTLTYAADLFDRSTAERMSGHLATLLAGAAADPDRKLAELPLLSAAERAQLAAWNATESAYAEGERTLSELFALQAAKTPDAVAATTAGVVGEALTYAALAARANALAARLRDLGVGPETVVGLCAERSLDMIVALLGILEAGGAYLPLDPSYPAERLAAILADAEVPVILAQERLLDHLPAHAANILMLDRDTGRAASPVVGPAAVPDDLAYVLFTSGSTGRPKGVMNSHRGIVNRILWMQEQYGLTPADRVLQKTPYSFDVSVWEFFWPLLKGARLVFALPGGHQDSAYLVRTIAEEGITVTHFVPSMLAAFLAEPDIERCASLAQVMASGEALPPELGQRFFGRLGARLHNLYGPTEAAVDVTFWECEREPAGLGVPIGRPVANTGIHLFDPEGTPVPVGVPGELGIGGVQVARGYAGRPDLTAERFVPDPFSPLPGGRLYRTGDLARRRPGGEVEYLGRLDHQVKLRGLRIELGEIESVLAAHPGVLAAAVVVREARPGDPRLVAYVVGRGAEIPATADFRAHLGARLPEYMVPALFVYLDALPLTPSGKTDRRALPAPEWRGEGKGGSAEVLLLTPTEEIVALIWSEVLGLPAGERIAPGDSFFELGGHSLLATQVVSRLRQAFGVELPLRRLFERPTLAGLAAAVEEARTALAAGREVPLPPIVRGRRPADLPLSFAQERLWLLDQLEPGSFAYNLPTALRLRGEVDVAALGASLGEIVRRHESLRTRFVARSGKPVQVILAPEPFPVPVVDLAGLGAGSGVSAVLAELAEDDARRPFDLAAGPLFRVTLLRLAADGGESLLLLNLHHIISDGWSVGVFVRELAALYAAARLGRPSPLPELPVQAADFALWQRRQLGGDLLASQIAWWRERLSGAPTLLELPADRPRPQVRRSRGAHHPFTLPALLAAEVRAFSRRTGATPFMTLLAAFQALLARYTGQRDLLVGSPVAGRTQREIEGLIGFFVNTLVLRLDLGGQPGFRTLVERAREAALGAYDHQEIPFERLVEALQPERHLSHTPFFQVLFALQNAPLGKLELPGLALAPMTVESGIAKFDLTLGLREVEERLTGVLEYDRDLFEAATAARIVSHFETLLAGALADPGFGLAELPLLSAAERQQVRVEWNDPRVDYPDHGLLPGLLAAVAERRPEAVALCQAGEQVSRGELAARAGRIARHLRALGLAPESRVGIAVERSPAMVAGLLGVWEAGGAYLPLDPTLPAERLSFMLADAGVEAILADRRTAAALPAVGVPLLAIEDLWAGEPEGPVPAPLPLLPEQAAYLLYTSGSTGKPKGVAVSHAAVGNRIRYVEAAEVAAADRFLHKTTLLFDASIGEIFSPLLAGATMVLAAPGEERDPGRLIALVEREEVTLASFTASMLAALLEERSLERCLSLRSVFTGAEVVAPELATWFYAQSRGDLYNRYGPTETTISVLAWHCARGEAGRALPIGRPMARTEVYIQDFEGAALPAGVAGELCLGGPCLARGYHDRPDLTAEKFVPHPSPAALGERLYRTGDLARFRADGAVEFLGRIDRQVKIRGLRIELGEIEAVIAEHPAVERAVVVDRDEAGTGGKRLVAYYVQRQGMAVAPRELALALREKMPDYMVPSAWGVLDALPLTVTGKVDRRALPEPEQLEAAEEGEAARGPVEELLAGIWTDLLSVRQVRRQDSFFALGGHSLLATQVVSRVREALEVELPLKALFEAPTLVGFAAVVAAAERAGERPTAPPLRTVSRDGAPPLSFGQERLWFLAQMQPGSALYNMPAALALRGHLAPRVLEAALGRIVERHEVLRTTFAVAAAGPVQRIAPTSAPAWAPALPEVDLEALAGPGVRETELARLAREEARRPFDLARGPLLRATLVRLTAAEHAGLFTLHHAVCDGWSIGIFVREVAFLYAAIAEGGAGVTGERPSLPALPIQYADFAFWQREWLSGAVLEGEIAWWRERLAGAPTTLDLPADRPRLPVPSYRGGACAFALPAELAAQAAAFGRQHDMTLFMTLFAAFAALLSRYTGHLDLLLGSPVANRDRLATEGLIGLFVNTLVLRADLGEDPGFATLGRRVRGGALAAFAHQDLPFEKLVVELAPERSTDRSPLVQVMLALQGAPLSDVNLPGLAIESLDGDIGGVETSKFDLTLFVERSDGPLSARLVYARDLFDAPTVERLAVHFRELLAGALAVPERRLSDLPLLTAAERHQLLAEWNEPRVPFAAGLIPELFAAQAAWRPQQVAVVAEAGHLTYAELEARANRLARHLRRQGAGPEARVGLCLERSPEMVIGLLAILKAGAAYLPLDPALPAERLALMLEDGGVRLVVGDEQGAAALPAGGPARAAVVRVDRPGGAAGWAGESPEPPRVALAPDHPAYVLYTSGSTGRPKGVVISHRAAANRLRFHVATDLREPVALLQKTTISFDVSVLEICGPLLSGGRMVLARPGGQQDAAYLVRLIAERQIGHVTFAPSMLALLLEEGLGRCHALRTVVTGSEAVPVELAVRFHEQIAAELFNRYGPTEATIAATAWRCSPGARERVLPIGRPIAGAAVYVVDRELCPLPAGGVGEIVVGGVGLARGYLGAPALTAEKFVPHPLAEEPGARLYRTGDRGRFRPDGALEFLGRADGQVKIRGLRVELGEIESALLRHPGVQEAVVMARAAESGGPRLVAYLVPAVLAAPAILRLRDFLAERLPDYMVPSTFVPLSSLPVTPSGKVDRRALAEVGEGDEMPQEEGSTPPEGPIEELLAAIWADLLGGRRPGREDDFFALGGHSLLATRVVSRVREALGVEVALRRLFEAPTLAGFAAAVEAAGRAGETSPAPPLRPLPRDRALPLSFAQERLWFLDQLEPGSAAYHMPAAVRFRGRLSPPLLAASLAAVTGRHEALRTTFAAAEGRATQVLSPALAVALPVVDLGPLLAATREGELTRLAREEARRPFDLGRGPLFRAALLRLAGEEHVALLTLHHIVSDGWSMGILVRELATAYGALVDGRSPGWPELAIQYADYAAWQRGWLSGPVLEAEIAWWRQQLAGAPAVLELPADRPRPPRRQGRGGAFSFRLAGSLATALDAAGRRFGATAFMLLLAAFAALLERYSGQEEVVVGSPIANRTRREIEGLIGFFVNTLALRASLAGDPAPGALVARVREMTLAAYGHQDLPFEKLVEALQPERSLAHAPVFQVLLVLQNTPRQALRLPDLTLEPLPAVVETTKLDLTLALSATADGFAGIWEYDRDLFDAATVARMAGGFELLLAALAAPADSPEMRLSDLPLLSAAERQQLAEWSAGETSEPADLCLHELFLAQAARTPAAEALIWGDERLTYGELAARVERLAGVLAALGVGPEVRVGVCLARTAALPVALLAVLAAGGAYVPLDPEYPEERLRLMLEDSGAAILLTQADLAGRLPEVPESDCKRVLLAPSGLPVGEPSRDADGGDRCRAGGSLPPGRGRLEQGGGQEGGGLAYLIYTSGSTGKPKGVAIEHRSAVALALWARRAFSPAELSGVLFATSVCFDLSVFELFVPLAWGGRVIVADNALALPRLAAAGEVTLVNTVPSAMAELVRQGALPPSVRTVNLAGEPLPRPLVDALYALGTVERVWNLYGPSEDTTYSTAGLQERSGEGPPGIGRPLAGTRAHVLDRAGRPVLVGVVGELHLGGAGLARGYFGRPELTAKRFVPDPYATSGDRLYRTGDLARLLPGGELHFLGRIDHQVKVRGFRIELGEIEALLRKHPAVREAVVLAREDQPGDRRLVAYVVPAADPPSSEALRASLAERLPEYMVPAAFVFLPALPLTASGKVDRKILPAPEWRSGEAFVAPRTPLEEVLAGFWHELLGVERAGVHDSFFRLGGHSLLATQLVARVAKTFQVELPLRRLFETPTVEALAAAVLAFEAKPGQSEKIARVLLRIKGGRMRSRWDEPPVS